MASPIERISTPPPPLSDLAQATIRQFANIYPNPARLARCRQRNQPHLANLSGKMGVPSSFYAMGGHREAQDVADTNFLPDELDDLLDQRGELQ